MCVYVYTLGGDAVGPGLGVEAPNSGSSSSSVGDSMHLSVGDAGTDGDSTCSMRTGCIGSGSDGSGRQHMANSGAGIGAALRRNLGPSTTPDRDSGSSGSFGTRKGQLSGTSCMSTAPLRTELHQLVQTAWPGWPGAMPPVVARRPGCRSSSPKSTRGPKGGGELVSVSEDCRRPSGLLTGVTGP